MSIECRKIYMYRCVDAVRLSIGMQYFLLTIFLLFVNFNIFHPINWITTTFWLMLSLYTWLSIMPLISAVIVFGVLVGRSFLAEKKYYVTRFAWLWGTALQKGAFFCVHLIVGILTSWLYSRFLHEHYRSLMFQYFDRQCVNSRYTFLVFSGVWSGFFFFVKENLKYEPEIEYSTIQETKFVKIRSVLYSTIYSSLVKSFAPTICFAFVYWMLGATINRKLANVFSAEVDETYNSLFAIMTNFRMLFYAWILCSQILCTMQLMNQFHSILLSEEMHFVIVKNPVVTVPRSDITLVEGLAFGEVPIIQRMASLFLYRLTVPKASNLRQEIFTISFPGGQPYNWYQLSGQCFNLIKEFAEELALSVKRISTTENAPVYTQLKPSAGKTAEIYNETYSIRRMVTQPPEPPQPQCSLPTQPTSCDRVSEALESFQKTIQDGAKAMFYAVPGLFYLFEEQDGAKTAFLLSNSQSIVWLTQGLAGICASSLNEDKYGVVLNDMPEILKLFLKLDMELDKLNNVDLNGKKCDRNLITLKNAVKRSLYRICSVFADYIKYFVDDQEDLRHLQCFVSYREM